MLLPEDSDELMKKINSIGSESWSCASAPIQYAAIEAYKTESEIIDYRHICRDIHEIMTLYVYKRLKNIGLTCPEPQGAFYLFPDWNQYQNSLIKNGIKTSIGLSETLLKVWNVATLPGYEFGMAKNNYCLRIASVDYDGVNVLNMFKNYPKQAKKEPEQFIKLAAPRLVKACDQIKSLLIH